MPDGFQLRLGYAALALVLTALMASGTAAAQPAGAAPAPDAGELTDPATERGRQAFASGVKLAKAEQWGEALAAFEEAAAARNAPLVQFNIAYCQRALGRYVAARETTARVVSDPAGLAASQVEEARAYLAEFDKVLVRVRVVLEPPTAVLTVDGRPLVPAEGQAATFLAGIAPPGDGAALGKRELIVVLDPGVHLFRATRPGHQDAIVQKSYRAGDNVKLDLRLDVLPATIAIKSTPGAGIVRINDREVGLAPIEFQRPAGRYSLEVVRDEYEPYRATLDLRAGQRADLTAKLVLYEEPITKKWWFWTGAAVVVTGGVLLTYALTRPEPTPPPFDGGSTGWVLDPSALRW